MLAARLAQKPECRDRNRELMPFFDGARISQPKLFVAGEKDPVLDFLAGGFAALEQNVPRLVAKTLLSTF